MTYDPTKDPYKNFSGSLTTLGQSFRAITPHADNDIEPYPKAIEVTVAGNLTVLPLKGETPVTYTAVPVGFSPKVRCRRVLPATTATVIAIDD